MNKNNYLIKINGVFSNSILIFFAFLILIFGLYVKYWNIIFTENITVVEKNNPGYEALSLLLFSLSFFLVSAHADALRDKNTMIIMIFFGFNSLFNGFFVLI